MTDSRCQYCKRTGVRCAEPYLMTDMEQVAAIRDCRNAMADSALAAEAKLQAVRRFAQDKATDTGTMSSLAECIHDNMIGKDLLRLLDDA